MDILLIALRLIHIVTAFVWFGLGAVSTFYLVPAAVSTGESGMRYLKGLFGATSFARLLPIMSGVTTLAGLLLYATGSPARFTTAGNIVLGIGALAGLAATIHGGAVTGRATREFGMALGQLVPNGGAIPADAMSQLNAKAAALLSHSRISMILMIVALIGMGTARYL